MKRIYLLLLFNISAQLFAQDWNTIVVNDTAYFSVQAPPADSIWNGYLRCIWADSSATSLGVTTHYFYPSIRLDMNNVMDTLTGDTWLGKRNLRNSSGDEFYFNKQGDTILLKTLANLGDTWILNTDSNNLVYHATVTSIDTMTIDGAFDSIKTIQLQAFLGASPVSSVYNFLPITLSKDHGFYSVFEFYDFPYCQSIITQDSLFYFGGNGVYFPIFPFLHHRIQREVTELNYKGEDKLWVYQPGNEWIFTNRSNFGADFGIIHDSVMNVIPITPDSITVELYEHSYSNKFIGMGMPNPYYTSIHTYDTLSLTMATNIPVVNAVTIRMLRPEYRLPLPFTYQNLGPMAIFVTPFCTSQITVKDTFIKVTPLSVQTWISHSNAYTSGFKKTGEYEGTDMPINPMHSFNMVYARFGSCVEGTKINFKTLSNDEATYFLNNVFIYPNPSTGKLTVSIPENVSTAKIALFNMQGMKIMEDAFRSSEYTMDISSLSNGIYFVEIKTDKGTANRKILKQ